MNYTRVYLQSIGYELAPDAITSTALEARLGPVYEALHLQSGQLEALTGIRERRWWEGGHRNAPRAAEAGRRALADSSVDPGDLEVVIYAGVCRDQIEPATACAVAAELGVASGAEVFDVSNACLGALNGILAIANRIELGQIRAGIVVCCESAREISEIMIEKMIARPTMDFFKTALATMTGGSGAAAIILTDGSFEGTMHKLTGAVTQAAPEHHAICRWEFARPSPDGGAEPMSMHTDALSVLQHGVPLGARTWEAFLRELSWTGEAVDRVICHQVAASNRDAILDTLGIAIEKDFSTFEYLGNMGTVSLPLTAALAAERGFLSAGDRVAFLGIGSGLNCMMLGWEW